MMTERENYLKILRGEQPEWVPNYFDACACANPMVFKNIKVEGSGNPDKKIKDIFGVEFNDREKFVDMQGIEWTWTVDGCIPTPGKVTMTDVTKWREQLNYPFPDLDQIDFKAQAEKLFSTRINRDEQVVSYMGQGGRFFDLINTMGVEEALCAMLLEPKAVHDYFQEMTDYDIKKLRLSYPYFKPDVYVIGDDVANTKNLFISPELYDELLAPYHRRLANAALELGCIVEMHCCGRCEELIPRWIDMGITVCQPMQHSNDLKGIKEKYGNKFVFNGGWNTSGPGNMTGASEEVVRQSVRDAIDTFAPGGGFIFWDGGMTGGDTQKFGWIADEARKYGREFYAKQKQ